MKLYIDASVNINNIKPLEHTVEEYLTLEGIFILKNNKYIVEGLTTQDSNKMYRCFYRLSDEYPIRNMDMIYVKYDSFYTALLHMTGSKHFNQWMRRIAKKQSYKLNRYSLSNNREKKIKINSERYIFDVLGLQYIKPQYRK